MTQLLQPLTFTAQRWKIQPLIWAFRFIIIINWVRVAFQSLHHCKTVQCSCLEKQSKKTIRFFMNYSSQAFDYRRSKGCQIFKSEVLFVNSARVFTLTSGSKPGIALLMFDSACSSPERQSATAAAISDGLHCKKSTSAFQIARTHQTSSKSHL